MKPPAENIRLGKQSRDQLIKIKRNTGIENWNTICRWALCVSLNEPTPPPKLKASSEDGVEMTWKVFGGEHSEVYIALLKISREMEKGNCGMDDAVYIHAHIRRGLAYLASGTERHSIESMLAKWIGSKL